VTADEKYAPQSAGLPTPQMKAGSSQPVESARAAVTDRAFVAPWVTVVIPSYGGEQWIASSLQSLADEASEGIEVIVVDSSPTSATRDIAQSFSDRLRLRVFERRDLPSWQIKTNFGVEKAESAHVCWLGVDDTWLPGRAAAVRSWIGAGWDVPLHLAPCAIIDKVGRKLGVWRCPLPAKGEIHSAFVVERLLVQNFIAAPAPVFRRDAWMACGGLDEKLWYTADWDIWLKLSALGPISYHDVVTVGFRIHGASLTVTGSRDAGDFAQQMKFVLDRHLNKLSGGATSLERVARASIAVNTALAAASVANLGILLQAACQVLRLGPSGIRTYLRDSRIVERVAPRVRAKMTGAF
jgi:glycosyltransferase involved in cell wall biosynthesis